MRVRGKVGGVWATVIVDTGCSGTVMGVEFARKLGYEEEEDTWEPWESVRGAKDTEELAIQFHRRLSSKPRDGRVHLFIKN